jgi:hypothetical protein
VPKIEDVMPPEEIAKAVERVRAVPPETFGSVAAKLDGAAETLRRAAKETDGRKRLDLLFELNVQMQTMARELGGIGL